MATDVILAVGCAFLCGLACALAAAWVLCNVGDANRAVIWRRRFETLGDAVQYLISDQTLNMEWFEGNAIGVELPPVVELKVVETPPGVKDATASAQRKPATMETGLVVQVPSFIEEGEVIRVSTLDGSYAERAK